MQREPSPAVPRQIFGLPARVWEMTFGHFAIDSNSAVIFALLPLFIAKLHISLAQAGLLATALLMTSSLSQPIFGFVHDRYQTLPISSVGLLVGASAMALTGFATSYSQVLALVMVAGTGVAAFHPPAVAQVGHASVGKWGWGIAIFFTGGSAGSAAMTLLIVPAALRWGLRATALLLLPALLAVALFTRASHSWLLSPTIRGRAGSAPGFKQVSLPVTMLLLVSIFRSAVLTAYLTFIPTLVVVRTHSLTLAGASLAAFLLSGSIGAVAGGLLANRFGSDRVMLAALIGGTIGLLPAPWVPSAILVPWLLVSGTVLFASEAQVTALAQLLLPNLVGFASSLMMGVGLGLGNAGGVLTGVVADRTGIAVALTLTTFLMFGSIVAATVFVLWIRRLPLDARAA